MTLGSVVTTRRTAKTWRAEAALSAGPLLLGRPGAGTLRELYGAAWLLVLTRDRGPRLLQLQGGAWADQGDPGALGKLGGRGVRHVSLTFDQAARPVLAWEQAGAVYVQQWDPLAGEYRARGPYPGRDPVVFSDALLCDTAAASDVQLYHLAGPSVVLRLQREQYDTARLVLELQESGAVLDQVTALGAELQLIGERASGAAWVARSGLYPLAVSDGLQGGAAVLGALLDSVQQVAASDGLQGGAAVLGALLDSVQQAAASDGLQGAGTVSGVLVVIVAQTEASDGLQGAGTVSGVLAVVVAQTEASDGLQGAGSITGSLTNA